MYESVALFWTTCNAFRDVGFAAEHAELCENGWEEYARAPCKGGAGGACIMRRPKDEPRMWTERELQKLIRDERICDVLMGAPPDDRELVKSILEGAQTEADMQAAYVKELLAAMNRGDIFVSRAVKEQLYPQAKQKEETNG